MDLATKQALGIALMITCVVGWTIVKIIASRRKWDWSESILYEFVLACGVIFGAGTAFLPE